MPKSQIIENKEINGIKVDKENSKVFFNDETHKYYDKNTLKTYISVTTLISNYVNKFDAEFWSAYKALEEIMPSDRWCKLREILLNTKKFQEHYLDDYQIDKKEFYLKQQEIKDEYARASAEGCEKGTKKHLDKELSFYNRTEYDFSKYGISDLKGSFSCKEDYFELDSPRGIYPEYLISVESPDGVLRVAGQIDCLVIDNNDVYIIDWKTNKEIKKRSYFDKKRKKNVMMKAPLNNLEDSTWNHYQLQLSLYAYLMEQVKPGCNIKKLQLVHLRDDGSEEIMECKYLKDDVERMLKHYKRSIKVQAELNKIKPIKIG